MQTTFSPFPIHKKTCHKIYSTTLWNCNKFLKVYNPENGNIYGFRKTGLPISKLKYNICFTFMISYAYVFWTCILHSIHICLMLSKKLEGNAKSYRFVQLRYINFNFKKVLYFLFSKTKLLNYGLEYFRSQSDKNISSYFFIQLHKVSIICSICQCWKTIFK